MPRDAWLVKMKKIRQNLDSVTATSPFLKKLTIRQSSVGILAFEVAGLMDKLLHIWQSLSDAGLARLRAESTRFPSVRKIVSDDDAFLFHLARDELLHNLFSVAKSIASITHRCEDPFLRSFQCFFREFAESGRDPHNWLLSPKEIESAIKKVDRYITTTKTLHGKINELSSLRNSPHKSSPQNHINDIYLNDASHNNIIWQRQEIKHFKKKSLWSRSFDKATILMARLIFTIFERAKLVFGDGDGLPSSIPRGQSPSSALVHPLSVSSPLPKGTLNLDSFLEPNSKTLKPLPSTLGAASLALHYSNLIIAMEKMIYSPQLVGANARDDLYAMLPDSIRFTLRARLKGVGFSANNPGLAGQWRDAVLSILGWMSPLAHNMVKWQGRRVFKQHNLAKRAHGNVLLLQTLYFANREKTEAAITELLVGLNYIWRFEREMKATAMSQGINLNPCVNSQAPRSLIL